MLLLVNGYQFGRHTNKSINTTKIATTYVVTYIQRIMLSSLG